MTKLHILLLYYLVMSVLAIILYGADKYKAKKKRRRVRESVLLSISLLGGAAGALLAMNRFRHKTRHLYFWATAILGLLLQITLAVIFRQF